MRGAVTSVVQLRDPFDETEALSLGSLASTPQDLGQWLA